MSRQVLTTLLVGMFATWIAALETRLEACPFCSAVSQTFTEEIASMDAVLIATLVELPAPSKAKEQDRFGEDVAKAKFKIVEVIKGSEHVDSKQLVEAIYFGTSKKGQAFLIMGVDPPNLMWSTPLSLTERARKYLGQLGSIPPEGAGRLKFFQDYLEDPDELLARDSYDEFAKAPYDAVKKLKPHMQHGRLIEWINDPDIPASRRRLYLTLLGVCGTKNDLPLLEEMLQSEDRRRKAGLDAMIACYLTLKGPTGMNLIEDLFLKNKKSEYADTYAAIMALRFHGSEAEIIPKKRLLEGLRYMLERPQLADLVIPDLARWEDWSQMDRLVTLFKDADEKSSWVRVPVINFLRACPRPEAKGFIEELEKIDPAAVKRARTFFPLTPATSDPEDPKTSAIPGQIESLVAVVA